MGALLDLAIGGAVFVVVAAPGVIVAADRATRDALRALLRNLLNRILRK